MNVAIIVTLMFTIVLFIMFVLGLLAHIRKVTNQSSELIEQLTDSYEWVKANCDKQLINDHFNTIDDGCMKREAIRERSS